MSDINVSGQSGVSPTSPNEGTGAVTSGSQQKGASGKSTQSQSEQIVEQMIIQMEFPKLTAPWTTMFTSQNDNNPGAQTTLDATTSAMAAIIETQHQVMMSILEGWLNSIEEQKQRVEEEINSPKYQAWLETQTEAYRAKVERDEPENTKLVIRASAEFEAWVNSLPPGDRDEVLNLAKAESFLTGISNSLSEYIEKLKYQDKDAENVMPLVTGGLVISSGFISNTQNVVDVVSTKQVSVNPIQDAHNQMSLLIPSDGRAELGLLGAMMMYGNAMISTAEPLNEGPKGVKPESLSYEMAKNYAQKMISLVSNPAFTDFILHTVVHKVEVTHQMNKERPLDLANMIKTILLATALALVLKAEGSTKLGEDFGKIMTGEVKIPRDDIKGFVVKQLKMYLSQIPEADRTKLLESLMEYLDGVTKGAHLMDVEKVFEGLMKSSVYNVLVKETPS